MKNHLPAVLATVILCAAGCGEDDSDPTDGGASGHDGPAVGAGDGSSDRTGGDGPGAAERVSADSPGGDGGTNVDMGPPDLPPLAPPGPLFCGRPGLVFSGQEPTLDVFPIQDGLLLVRERSLLLVDRTGQVRRTVTMERDVRAASFDGTTLVVTDRAMLHRFRVDLGRTDSRLLQDLCESTLMVPERGVYCAGSEPVFTRLIYPPDPSSPPRSAGDGLVDSSLASLRPVPGRPDFVGPASNRFVYYFVGDDDRLNGRGSFRFPNEVRSGPFFAFVGNPATHIVDLAGLMFKIPAAECQQPPTAGDTGCLAADGALGTLTAGQSFVGLVEDSPSTALALVRPAGPLDVRNGPCLMGCDVQRIDLAGKKVLSQRSHRLDGRTILKLRSDARCDRLLVLSRTTEQFPSPSDTVADYRVHLLDHADSTLPRDPPPDFPPPPPPEPPPPPLASDGTRPCAPARMLYQGPDAPLGMFPTPAGVLVATAKGITLVGRDGVVKASALATGNNTSVAFDATRVVVADDQPGLSVLAPDTLAPATRMATAEACSGLVLLDGGRVICGGTREYNRIFYTLDTAAKTEVKRTTPFSNAGLTMMRVPGKPQFLAGGGISSRPPALFDVAADGTITELNQNQFTSGAEGMRLAFLGNPADQLVNVSGALAIIQGPGCPAMGMARSTCFARNGQLGVGRGVFRHLAIASDAAGAVYTLSRNAGSSSSDNLCGGDCTMEKIDVAARRIVAARPARLLVREALGSTFDAHCGHVLVSYVAVSSVPYGASASYRVDALDFRTPEVTP